MSKRSRRGARGFDVRSLPYKAKVYVNNQVLIPASLIRALNLRDIKYAEVTFRYKNQIITIKATLLRTRNTDSRQFTIYKAIREKYGIRPGDDIEIIAIKRTS
ncbi:MAG: AbrB/MazE/SpoVT family DNA-binding domain-containing protein [Thermoprotei archaeon]|nr:MAG: AbrB/MazE/SpoVT family DNA-binding domain-containing protein [Thermoprotei archaeon]RLE98876.1 MAG: AbrB/MazE/SpoVT family DNA-binding domain-containing protein [Thermoprotei archaeon]HDI74755.1 AbrB/MazE/SpoVT family DNA-binding domain-containing protein [Thermoprotei archaeon]